MPRGPKSVVEILAGGKKVQAEVAKACAKPKAGATVSAKSAKYPARSRTPARSCASDSTTASTPRRPETPSRRIPIVFCRFNNTLVPHNGKMPMPSHSTQLDWEAELTIVIGKKCRNVPKEKALGVIAGYACFNDGSVRDWQFKGQPVDAGQELRRHRRLRPRHRDLRRIAAGRGAPAHHDPRQRRGHAGQQYRRPDLRCADPGARNLRKVMTLDPGDIIITGTPSGVASGRTPPNWLKPGDVCEVEIEKIGVLRNPIVQGWLISPSRVRTNGCDRTATRRRPAASLMAGMTSVRRKTLRHLPS